MTALDDLSRVPFHDADAAQRARILSRLADTELSVALVEEPQDDLARFRIFDLPAGPVAIAFDTDARLADFFGAATPYAAMPGRVLAGALTDQGAGLMVNPGQPSEMLLDADALAWLCTALAARPMAEDWRARRNRPALRGPDPVVVAQLAVPLSERLQDFAGLIGGAALVGLADHGAEKNAAAGHLLIIADAPADRRDAIAKALAEALSFLPDVPGGIDIAFSEMALPVNALRFDLSLPQEQPHRSAPGRNGPPILR